MRHAESSKNIEDRFAGVEEGDALTHQSWSETAAAAEHVRDFMTRLQIQELLVLSSDSPRSMHSGEVLSSILQAEHRIDSQLRSVVNPETAGVSYSELVAKDPLMAQQWNLYRGGVFNSYAIGDIARNTRPYERVVREKLVALKRLDVELALVVGHRSFITSSLINVARARLGYPAGFFGFVPLGHLSLCALRKTRQGDWTISFVNVAPSDLSTLGVALLRAEEQ
ncbi:histidine phosphatase family protein [Asanoa iriomotensis]|uniref:Phosphoglycerate mutase n=1 Tax=Asanoa iriomotensis TaxID=234613 RepID=A0ABQ4C1L7_9ACTN|nr:histidine phosphatase family protein [Asanoa iriomotensis]GIF56686.1 hypothetical protein Air01nite_27810 [Asanoa iriomotensis]